MKQQIIQQRGATLIESIIGIIIFALALLSLLSGVFNSVSKSHQATYQSQATALGHSILTDILSRQFDQNSDADGDFFRCGEHNAAGILIACTASEDLGAESTDGDHSMTFNDVDDFIGCWGEVTRCSASTLTHYPFAQLVDPVSAEKYHNYTIEIQVTYVSMDQSLVTEPSVFKKVTITIYASSYANYTFSAYVGNY